MNNQWLLSTICGVGLLVSTAAFAQSTTQTIQLKPGQEAGTSTVTPADTAASPNTSTQDATFVREASAGGQAEIMMGQLAQQRGMTDATRSFGQMMIADHTKANQQLMQIAETLQLQPAAHPNAMQQMAYQHLQTVPASRFDTSYARINVKGHEMMAALFRQEIATTQNAALKGYAMQTLPVVEQHLAMAEKLAPMGSSSMMMMRMAPMGGSKSTDADHSADQLNARELATPTANPGS
jgi:putative membrane protein